MLVAQQFVSPAGALCPGAGRPSPRPQSRGRLSCSAEESMTDAYARIRAAREKSKKKYERDLALERAGPIGGLLTRLVRTIDLQEDILEDRAALNKARNMKSGTRMSQESADALKRKVGGTKGGFFGQQVELKGKYSDAGYVSSKSEGLQNAPLLIATLLGVLAVLAAVVTRT